MKSLKSSDFKLLCTASFLQTIAMTPWVNSDSLIIPKLIILFLTSLYILPKLIFHKKIFLENLYLKAFMILVIIIIIDLILIVIISDAPYAQQFFGRTGRGLGFITETSLLLLVVGAAFFISKSNVELLLYTLFISSLVTSAYSVLQRFGLDIFDWNTKTNGIIGTLGNPNFQSSFAAMALIPTLVYFWNKKKGKLLSLISIIPILTLIYLSQSVQGYILISVGAFVFILTLTWYKYRFLFIPLFLVSFFSSITVFLGMINKGPFSDLLYKPSVQSRGEFLRTGISITNDNPIFGVGLDSVGDYFLMYRSEKDAQGIGEFAYHLHNFFLQYSSVGGYPLAFLQLFLILLTLASYFNVQKEIGQFNSKLTALFCAWVCYLVQSLISPQNISMMGWNALITGSLIGLTRIESNSGKSVLVVQNTNYKLTKPFSSLLILIGAIIIYPYFNVDRQQLQSARTGNGNLAILSAKSFPESTVRYSRIGEELLKSNLGPQALEIARSAIDFNPHAPSAWGLLLVNNFASFEERSKAQRELIKLDPNNLEIRNFIIPKTIP